MTAAMLKVSGQDGRCSGHVRISTTDTFAIGLLPAVLQQCRQQYPLITFTVEADNRAVNLSQRDADIALRPSASVPEHLIGKLLAPLQFAVYGRRDQPAPDAAQFGAQDWVALDDNFSGHRTLRWLERIKPQEELAYRCNTFIGVRQACSAGLGLAILPCFLGDADSQLQRLSQILPECTVDLWLLTHPDLRQTTRVKLVFQFLQQALVQQLQH